MKEMKYGENIVELARDPDAEVLESFEDRQQPKELTDKEKKSDTNKEIKRKQVKDYVKQLKVVKSNLKNIYSLVFGNCSEGVHTMMKAEKGYNHKSKDFYCKWTLLKAKTIVLGLDTKTNL